MKKILFLIHDLGQGGAEKVLVNLVNNMDSEKFDITVIALFGGGVNEQFLKPHIHYRAVFKKAFPGNSHIMKLFSPKQLYKRIVKERYDVEIAYLEGPASRIISGSTNHEAKHLAWIHCTMHSPKEAALAFRSVKEAQDGFNNMESIIFVSDAVRQAFLQQCPYNGQAVVLYNTNDTSQIMLKADEKINEAEYPTGCIHWCGMGKVVPLKGFDRMLRVLKRLKADGHNTMLHILGVGPQQAELGNYARENGLENDVVFHGYQTNPYKHVKRCDLFVCASHSEGFSTAATEALIVGTPVCTVEVSGMKEMLGENNEYGVVTENDEEALYQGIKRLLDDPALLEHYTKQAAIRGKDFSTETTVKAVENMLLEL